MSVQVSRSRVVQVLRARGNHDAAGRAEDELPESFDPDDHAEVLLAYGVDSQDLDDQETLDEAAEGPSADDDAERAPTGLGAGTASGLGHSFTSEPEPLLDAGTGEDEPER